MAFGTLTIVYPGVREDVVDLIKPVFAVGSADDNDLVLHSVTIAPHHAQFVCDDTSCQVLDLGSASGTWVGPIRIFPQEREPLRDGTTVRVGHIELIFRVPGPDAPPAEPIKPTGRRWGRRAQPGTAPRQWTRRALLWTQAMLLVIFALLIGGWLLYPRLAPRVAEFVSQASSPTAAPILLPTEEPGQLFVVQTAPDLRLTIRARPDLNAPVVGRLANGTAVRRIEGPVAGGGFIWVRIESDELSGWCVQEGLRPR